MKTAEYQRAAGLYYNCDDAEAVVRNLKHIGYDMDDISVIAREPVEDLGQETVEIGNKVDEGATTGALTGSALGGITGLLVGLGTLVVPGMGPILLVGTEATTIATALAGVSLGAAAGGLVGALIGLGIPEERAKVYGDRVERGGFLVIVKGKATAVKHAATIMNRYGVEELDIYQINAPTSTVTQELDASVSPESTINSNELFSIDPQAYIYQLPTIDGMISAWL